VELRVVDPLGETLPTGNVGEIVIRAAAVMKGYWNQPEATRATFFDGGWFRTGDAGYFDADGFLYIHDRIKDMIISGAENVLSGGGGERAVRPPGDCRRCGDRRAG
jgi:acyl-CoA synthetase (AMP-forming)/AMP-acid ligase II